MSTQMIQQHGNLLTISNRHIERQLQLPLEPGRVGTIAYFRKDNANGQLSGLHSEFVFWLDGQRYDGNDSWQLNEVRQQEVEGGERVDIMVSHYQGLVKVELQYTVYSDSAAISKQLIITKLRGCKTALEGVEVESLYVGEYNTTTFSWIYSNYGRQKTIGPYCGNRHDALLLLHDPDSGCGIAVGNEAPGALKHTSVFWKGPTLSSGLTPQDDPYPFCIWLAAGEQFVTPAVFTILYDGCPDGQEAISSYVEPYVRKHLGARLFQVKEKPLMLYNTWVPFGLDINEKLIFELVDKAADIGVKEFIIDDGWSQNYGDWAVDTVKFPRGLKPVMDYIHSKGMKPGLWVSIATASADSEVYRQHPDWFITNSEGQHHSVHSDAPGQYTACMSTGWRAYITQKLLELVHQYHLAYLKLDFAVVTSPYIFDPAQSGCYATSHPGHYDRRESLYTNYSYLWEVFDRLHERYPQLFIDCTFETMGGLQLIDYAMLRHADGNWLSNFSGTLGICTDLRLRQMAWWRSPAMPATSLVIGNAELHDPTGIEQHLLSLAGSLPMLCGDLRQLNDSQTAYCLHYVRWLEQMERRHSIMSFRQDLFGLGEPRCGFWDGFQRINSCTQSGGIIGIFRHGSAQSTQTIVVKELAAETIYRVTTMDGDTICTASGKLLAIDGFVVTVAELYGGRLYEVSACLAQLVNHNSTL